VEKSIIKPVLFLLAIVLSIIFLLGLLLQAKVYGQEVDAYSDLTIDERERAVEIERKFLVPHHGKLLRLKGNAEIAEDEAISGDIFLVKGNLTISGEVKGNVVVLYGDIDVDSTAEIDGDVVSAGGKIWCKKGAMISGDIIETDHISGGKPELAADDSEKGTHREKKKSSQRETVDEDSKSRTRIFCLEGSESEKGWADYNRVDGLILGLRTPNKCWWEKHRHNFAILGKGGYSFASKRFQYQLGVERWMLDDFRFALGGDFHDITDTQDDWIIGVEENGLAAFLIREDFRDYYRRQGFSGYGQQYFGRYLSLKAEYRNEQFSNLVNETNWSLFGKHKKFRKNPSALPIGFQDANFSSANDAGNLELQSFTATVTFDARTKYKRAYRGWYIQAFAERAGYELKSDMEFERFIVDIRRYQPLGWDENLDIRLRAGSATGILPPMYWFDLGGISTLRGYDFKEFTGDRMVFGNVEYKLRTGKDDWFIFDEFDIILFVDSGTCWFASGETGENMGTWSERNRLNAQAKSIKARDTFDELNWSRLKTDVGIALASQDNDFRINLARRVDRGGSDIVVTLRLGAEF
jgi:cytoskeletal protein CcmA (bactofilin family)